MPCRFIVGIDSFDGSLVVVREVGSPLVDEAGLGLFQVRCHPAAANDDVVPMQRLRVTRVVLLRSLV